MAEKRVEFGIVKEEGIEVGNKLKISENLRLNHIMTVLYFSTKF